MGFSVFPNRGNQHYPSLFGIFLLLDGRTDGIGLPRKIDYGKPVYQRIRKSEVQNTPDLQKAKKAVAVQQNTRTVFLYHSGRVDLVTHDIQTEIYTTVIS